MLFPKPNVAKRTLQDAIDEIILDMHGRDSDSKEYSAMADQLVKLYNLKQIDAPKVIDPNTLILAGANLLGIVTIVAYEHHHVITSKALSLLLKLR